MKWRTRIMALAVIMVSVCGVVRWCWTRESALSRDSYEQIQIGMTKQEVEIMLGKPRREVKPQDPQWIDPDAFGDVFSHPEEWWWTEGVIQVWYVRGQVSHKDFTNHPVMLKARHCGHALLTLRGQAAYCA
jgi:hypothetical protein